MPPPRRNFPPHLADSATFRPAVREHTPRRDHLLDAAERHVADKGLLGASLQEIGAAIELPPYAVRAQFGNLTMVIEAVLTRHMDRLIDRVRAYQSHDDTTDPAERLVNAVLVLLEMLAAYAPAQKVHVAAWSGASPSLVAALKLRQRHIAYYYAGLIAAAVPETESRDLAMPAAMTLMGMACWHILWFRDRGAITREEYARLLAHMLIDSTRAAIAAGIGEWQSE